MKRFESKSNVNFAELQSGAAVSKCAEFTARRPLCSVSELDVNARRTHITAVSRALSRRSTLSLQRSLLEYLCLLHAFILSALTEFVFLVSLPCPQFPLHISIFALHT